MIGLSAVLLVMMVYRPVDDVNSGNRLFVNNCSLGVGEYVTLEATELRVKGWMDFSADKYPAAEYVRAGFGGVVYVMPSVARAEIKGMRQGCPWLR